MSGPPEIVLFLGRLHVLLIHLPIALVLLLATLELLARFPRFRHANANTGLILALAIPAAVFTALCGWMLSLAGGYPAHLLQWHKWTGISTAAIVVVAGVLYRLELKTAFRWCLFISTGALILASHFGGSLTHGSDYLVRYAPRPFRNWLGAGSQVHPAPPAQPPVSTKPPAEAQVFSEVVQPILQKDCVSCHGPSKAKGKLRLDSFAAVLKGGGSGPALVPGKAGNSEMIKRLRLDLGEDDHMPPKDKPQPTSGDITLLAWWIDAGASGDKKVGELKPPLAITRILDSRFGALRHLAKAVPPKPLKDILPLASSLSDDLHIVVMALSQKDAWLECNAGVAGTSFGDAQLARLAPLGPNLRWLDLGGTAVTDAGLAQLETMPNLSRLHLERTAITDKALAHVSSLANLEYLNLYATAVTDAGLRGLEQMPRLKQVYLWETKVTSTGATEFTAARTDTEQLDKWQQEIEQLKAKIRDAQISVDLGTSLANAAPTNQTPINTMCPVSGKPIDPSKTFVYEGRLIAFCCNDCKAKFEQDPKAFLAKLNLTVTNTLASGPKAP
ncbi:MAG TPA: c-type cytochrome domain-containing protein [Verrucomicrobiae bacterium]|nr:c-type cytochrome domain-containing protein [Verrucomicrobiae bacterium]